MIEGGVAGMSAQSLAAERRAQAEKLAAEASRLDATATDERWMSKHLAQLPSSYALLHDLSLPDGSGRVDHLVVGPGGAFVVLARRVDGVLSLQGDQLFAGGHSLKPTFDGARLAAQALTQGLGTPVVPIIALVGVSALGTLPGAIDGVLVTPADHTAQMVGRGSHTQLTGPQVNEVIDRVAPMLSVPGVRARGAAVPIPPPPAPVPPQRVVSQSVTPNAVQKPARTPHQQRSRRFNVAVAGMLLLTAFAGGTLVRTLFQDSTSSAAPAVTPAVVPTTLPVVATVAPTTTVVAKPKIAKIKAPKVAFMPICPAPGEGWSMVPAWPGKVKNLAKYQLEMLGADGTWAPVSAFKSSNTLSAAITGQGPNTTLTVRIAAILKNGSRSPATATPIITPATSC
jgi:hypothetical protein